LLLPLATAATMAMSTTTAAMPAQTNGRRISGLPEGLGGVGAAVSPVAVDGGGGGAMPPPGTAIGGGGAISPAAVNDEVSSLMSGDGGVSAWGCCGGAASLPPTWAGASALVE
jgi:hypothetical protein